MAADDQKPKLGLGQPGSRQVIFGLVCLLIGYPLVESYGGPFTVKCVRAFALFAILGIISRRCRQNTPAPTNPAAAQAAVVRGRGRVRSPTLGGDSDDPEQGLGFPG